MRKILTEAELACLLEVKTTPEQAKGIIARNKAMLKLLRRKCVDGRLVVRLPCPHCVDAGSDNGHYYCENCAYSVLANGSIDPVEMDVRGCLQYSFGGIVYQDVSDCVCLAAEQVYVTADIKLGRETVEQAIRWAEGHIEWAREVIRLAKCKKRKEPDD
jgi:hypothetical protein